MKTRTKTSWFEIEQDEQRTRQAARDERLLRLDRLAESQLKELEQRQAAEAAEKRREAFVKLKALDRLAGDLAKAARKQIRDAERKEQDLYRSWSKARSDLAQLKNEVGRQGFQTAHQREAMLARIRAVIPTPIENFVAKIDEELDRLAAKVPQVKSEVVAGRIYGYQSEPNRVQWFSESEAYMQRAKALVDAKCEALEMVDEDWPDQEIERRLDALWSNLPAIKFSPIHSPADIPEFPAAARGGDPRHPSITDLPPSIPAS